jgi:hypothetical protein
MANPYQQRVFQRKLVYLGLVVVLLAASWLWRRNVAEASARELDLLEESRGDVDLVGSTVRVGLVGLRGLTTCYLWWQATEMQKKNQWSKLEITVRTLTKLQPHFITPWLVQSWNLSWNVSNQSDSVRDKYFWIVRGIQLLAQGERQNRYQPDIRRDIGFYHQQRLCQHDATNALRSLFQLSCIKPRERGPERFRDADGKPKLEELRKFCEEHPQLARRLHRPPLPYVIRLDQKKFRCATAEELLEFLEDNVDVPSLYVPKSEDPSAWEKEEKRKDPLERFPVMPPERRQVLNPGEEPDETADSLIRDGVKDEFDPYWVARAWYRYAQECLPPPDPDWPGRSQPITDRRRQRRPRFMKTIIFRSAPARTESFIAERLQEEGWFDSEPYEITGWFGSDRVKIGQPVKWSEVAWRRAEKAWRSFGEANCLLWTDAEEANVKRQAEAFRKEMERRAAELSGVDPEQFDEHLRKGYEAMERLTDYDSDRQQTSLPGNLYRAQIEGREETIMARKLFYLGEHKRLSDQAYPEALAYYEDDRCLLAWRRLLERELLFRGDDLIGEQTVEMELKYHRLYRREHRRNLEPHLALQAYLGQTVATPPLAADWALLGLFHRPQSLPEFTITGPFDHDERGWPFALPSVRDNVLTRRGLKKASTVQGGPMMPEMPPNMSGMPQRP